MNSPLTLGVIGYSTRALLQAIVDLGHHAISIDAFGDQDTLELAKRVHVIDDWPHGISEAARSERVDGWLLGGGMENYAELLTHTSTKVLGPNIEQMQTLRSLSFLESLDDEGIHWPTTIYTRPLDDLSQWLTKPVRSAGGLCIRSAHEEPNAAIDPASTYWQRRIAGRVLGVTWIFHDDDCRLHGITQALDKHDWPGPSEFIYRGSIGPIGLNENPVRALTSLAKRVKTALPDYRGYLQADVIEDASGQLWLLEFNPRWTSGMEILHESAHKPQHSPLSRHLQAWGIAPLSEQYWDKPQTRLVSKAIYYSAADIELSQAARRGLQSLRSWQRSSEPNMEWCVADVPPVAPPPPMRFDAGSPILTVKSRQLAVGFKPSD